MVKPQDYNHRKSKVRKTIPKSIHHSKGERARELKISERYYIQPLFQVKAYKLVTRPKEVTTCKLPQKNCLKKFGYCPDFAMPLWRIGPKYFQIQTEETCIPLLFAHCLCLMRDEPAVSEIVIKIFNRECINLNYQANYSSLSTVLR